jgi:hypothetical protein
MTFQEKLNAKIATAQAAANAKVEEKLDTLLENDAFIESQRSLTAKNKELAKLDTTISALNKILPFVSKNGTKFDINVFPINGFDTGLDKVLGIITGSRSAFVDQLSLQYEAISGVSMIELTLARQALGSPAYFKDGAVVPAQPGSYNKLVPMLPSIALKLEIQEFDLTISEEQIELYFTKSLIKAETAKAEFDKNLAVNSSTSFTIQD